MTRFEQEISGKLGDFWKKDAEKKLKSYMKEASEKCIIEDDGAIKWKSNERYLMDDYCEILEYGGFNFSREATATKRDIQNEKSLEEYRKNPPKLTEEDLAEARAAFGEGTVIVDVITGKETVL